MRLISTFHSPIPSDIQTLIDLARYRAAHSPDQLAYRFLPNGEADDDTITYAVLDQRARAIAALLQDRNLFRERVLLFFQPGLEYIVAFLGCLYAGAIAVPAYPPRRNQKMTRIESIVSNCQATAVLTSDAILSNLADRLDPSGPLGSLNWLITDHLEINGTPHWHPPSLQSDDLAFLQYTSGSTGDPKGVMVTHANILNNSESIYRFFGHSTDSHALGWLPPYHDMGLIGSILQPLYGGFLGTLFPPVYFLQRPIRWLQAISTYGATTSGGPNFAYDLCVQKVKPEDLAGLDLSRWSVAFNGAEPVRHQTLERFAETFSPCGFKPEAFYPCYGMAETTLIISGGLPAALPKTHSFDGIALEKGQSKSLDPKHESAKTLVSSGRQQEDERLLIVDPESCRICPDGTVGEIWVSGPSIAKGYWGQPDRTAQTFHACLAETGEGPFLRTGDLGFLQDGELFVTGRIKDLIIIRGQNHYPQDIELTVEQSHPSLSAGSGAAFTVVDVQGNEHLVVVQEVERSFLRKLDIADTIKAIKTAVALEHNLQAYAIALLKPGGIPKTSSGKVRRHACRLAFLSGSLSVLDDWSENPRTKQQFQSLKSDVDALLSQIFMSH